MSHDQSLRVTLHTAYQIARLSKVSVHLIGRKFVL